MGSPRNMRDVEIVNARETISPNPGSSCTVEILSITRDVPTSHRDRDFRTMRLFLLCVIKKLGIQAIRIVEVNGERSSAIVRNSPTHPVTDETNPLYFIAHRGYMRWLQPSILTGVNLWKNWRTNFDGVRDITVLGWVIFFCLAGFRKDGSHPLSPTRSDCEDPNIPRCPMWGPTAIQSAVT